ncbi:MAG: hypothetical protein V3U62_06010 [Sedimenticolaceae bacterium]|uniref:hypothetical protein n=1 Tax=Candidatus Vondammii sp. HM_W22 TaxID=2687299 RepID=UPI002A4E112F|nr:hypothetical protein [Candidatus Vondammii sp. HM_W22]
MAASAIQDGVYDFLEKLFPTENLAETVRRAMDKRALTLGNRNLRQELGAHSMRPDPILLAIRRLCSICEPLLHRLQLRG